MVRQTVRDCYGGNGTRQPAPTFIRLSKYAHVGHQPRPAPVASRRQWLTPRLIGLLAGGTASTLVIAGIDVSVVAMLRDAGQVDWTGVVLALWASCSLIGGFTYGALSRSLPSLILTLILGLVTIPIGLGSGQWWLRVLRAQSDEAFAVVVGRKRSVEDLVHRDPDAIGVAVDHEEPVVVVGHLQEHGGEVVEAAEVLVLLVVEIRLILVAVHQADPGGRATQPDLEHCAARARAEVPVEVIHTLCVVDGDAR